MHARFQTVWKKDVKYLINIFYTFCLLEYIGLHKICFCMLDLLCLMKCIIKFNFTCFFDDWSIIDIKCDISFTCFFSIYVNVTTRKYRITYVDRIPFLLGSAGLENDDEGDSYGRGGRRRALSWHLTKHSRRHGGKASGVGRGYQKGSERTMQRSHKDKYLGTVGSPGSPEIPVARKKQTARSKRGKSWFSQGRYWWWVRDFGGKGAIRF